MHLNTCVHFLVCKQYKVSFVRKALHRKSNILDPTHSDACGPMKDKTFVRGLYF